MKSDYRYFIAVSGECKDCGYPVICEAGDIIESIPNIDCELDEGDFHLYCSNPDCKNHSGLCAYDTAIDSKHVPFLNRFAKEESHEN